MMRSILLLPFLASLGHVLAQIPIAQARDLPVGSVVTVRGIVLNGAELGSIRYVQDPTAGIAVFPGAGSIGGFNPPRGADMTVTGPLKLFNGLLEIDPVQSFTVHSTGNALPTAQVVTPNGMGESNESELLRINACQFSGGGNFSSGTRGFTSNGQQGVIFLRSGHPLVGTPVPAGIVDLVGICSQFATGNPPVGGYQLLPRDASDFPASGTITVTSDVTQKDITSSGFKLEWNTNVAGSSRVRFGLTPSYGSVASATGTHTAHSVQLGGLTPATFYYAQAFSVLGTDTAFAPPGIYSTASAFAGDIKVYFNRPVDNSVSQGSPAIHIGSAMLDTIIAYIDRAESTLDIAVYNTNSNAIVSAVNEARQRGVQIRWIAEGSTGNTALSSLHPAIPVLYRQNSQGSGMHNKFIVADADGGPTAHVLTGSANFTNQSFTSDANNLVIVRDMALARCYRREFNEMWGSNGAMPNAANSRFGSAKNDDTPHLFNVGGTLVQSWFSPSDGTTARIAQSLATSDQRIEFALFAFTTSTLSNVLLERQAQPSVTVRGIIEEDDMVMWLYEALLAGGVDVRPDGAPNFLHHKYAIVDRHMPGSDPQVITGSHNWSFNAENHNDENTLIIHSAEVADQFYQEWHARWITAVAIDEEHMIANGLLLWPNPTDNLLFIGLGAHITPTAEVRITDMAGRVVHAERLAQLPAALDVSSLAPGSYVLDLIANDLRAQRRFVRYR
ncbi:MAG: T9SS type A sorting domain-containing protein [Flavobacteriales bacterium]|nr:T9SS type A sorting domain-containing protein [Flavobacteriales bacterium]